ncbi:hypothetical protein FJZ17_00110 [Candidatus Pacearchaeota archaeon]|nr:hypothetical protein [Candidatus Pacearchaeota archaeon]
MMFKRKKGDIAITILVIMTVLLVGFALFMFMTSKASNQEKIQGSSELLHIYSEQQGIEFTMRAVAEKVLTENQGAKFGTSDFIVQFKQEFSNQAEGIKELEEYNLQVQEGNYAKSKVEGNKLYFYLSGFRISKVIDANKDFGIEAVNFNTDVVFEIDF